MKKFKLLAFTMLASSLALSSCMLLPKKKTSSSTSEPTSTSSTTSEDPSVNNWSDSVLNEMKQYMDGEVIPYFSGTWKWGFDEEYGCYSGVSTDTGPSVPIAAFDSTWNKSIDTENDEGAFTKIHTGGVVNIQVAEYDDGTYVDCYYIEESTDWDADLKESLEQYFGEVPPFPAGTWSTFYATAYEGVYYIQSGHSYNYTAMKTLYESKGYTFYEDEYGESFFKKTLTGYLNGYFDQNTDLKVGFVYFYLTDEPPVEEEFELTANKAKALVNEEVTLTVTRGSTVEVGAVTYTVSPSTAATLKSSDNSSAVFTIKEAGELTFTAKQGDYESTVTIKTYTEYPKPTSITFKKASYTIEQGKTLDLKGEFTVLPEDADDYSLSYEVTGNSGLSISNSGVVSATASASTSQTATVKISYSATVYGTCTLTVVEPAKEVTVTKTIDQIADANSWVSEHQQLSFKLDDVVSVEATSGTNNAKYYDGSQGKQWRIYHAESGAFTISVPAGNTLLSITITFKANNDGTLKGPSGAEVASGTAVAVTGNSATFTADGGNNDAKTNGQARITSISVTYK